MLENRYGYHKLAERIKAKSYCRKFVEVQVPVFNTPEWRSLGMKIIVDGAVIGFIANKKGLAILSLYAETTGEMLQGSTHISLINMVREIEKLGAKISQ